MNSSRLRWAVLPAALMVGLAAAAPAADADEVAPERRIVGDKFNLSLGGFVVDFDTSAQAGSGNVGGLVQFEDDLAVDSESSTGRLDGFFRFNPKHSIDFGYFALNRSGARDLNREITFNDVTYAVGVRVSSEFDVDLARLAYRYSFVNDGKTEAGFVAGLSTYGFAASIEGQGTVDGGQTIQRVRAEEDVLAPIPVVGMFIAHAFTPRWVLRLNAEFFDIQSGDYAGRVVDTRVLLGWFFSRHVGIEVGTSTTTIDFSKEGSSSFQVEYEQDGLLAAVSMVF